MEDIINTEVEEFSAFLMDEASKAEDGAIDAQNVYNISILNALWRIISGNHNENIIKSKFVITRVFLICFFPSSYLRHKIQVSGSRAFGPDPEGE